MIKLTRRNSNDWAECWVNPKHIRTFWGFPIGGAQGTGTHIILDVDSLDVKETPQEILHLMEQARANLTR